MLGLDLNPAIRPRVTRATSLPVIARLRHGLPPGGRAVGRGRGAAAQRRSCDSACRDVRNYDSVELASSLAWFEPALRTGARPPARAGAKSPGEGVIAARDRLLESGVGAVVAAVAPSRRRVRSGRAGRARLDRVARAASRGPTPSRLAAGSTVIGDHGWARILVDARRGDRLMVRETWDPGWKALLDGKPVEIQPKSAVFLNIEIPAGQHELILKYDPVEVRLGLVRLGLLAGCLDSGVDRNSIVLDSWNNHGKGLGRS